LRERSRIFGLVIVAGASCKCETDSYTVNLSKVSCVHGCSWTLWHMVSLWAEICC